jgi:hypothetical protein
VAGEPEPYSSASPNTFSSKLPRRILVLVSRMWRSMEFTCVDRHYVAFEFGPKFGNIGRDRGESYFNNSGERVDLLHKCILLCHACMVCVQYINAAYGKLHETVCVGPNTPASPVNSLSLLIQSAGISNRHPITLEAKTRSTLPPSSNGISSRIMLVP